MWVYSIRRIAYIVPIVLGVALVLFVIFNMIGLDPVYQLLPKHATAQQVTELRHELGLDRPLPQQFVFFLKQIVTFDFGRSYSTHQKISSMLMDGAGPSLSLMAPAFFSLTLIAIVVSLFVAYFRGRWIDKVAVILCVSGMSVSILAYIIAFQYFFAFKLGWFPISGYSPGFAGISYIMLPVIIYITVGLGYDVRVNRTFILDEINQDYVRTARAKGVSESVIMFKHVLKNSMIPIITQLVIAIPFLFLGSLLLENFFGIPGLGSMAVDAINNNDFPVIKAIAILGSILFVFGQLLSDLLYAWVDPRVKLG